MVTVKLGARDPACCGGRAHPTLGRSSTPRGLPGSLLFTLIPWQRAGEEGVRGRGSEPTCRGPGESGPPWGHGQECRSLFFPMKFLGLLSPTVPNQEAENNRHSFYHRSGGKSPKSKSAKSQGPLRRLSSWLLWLLVAGASPRRCLHLLLSLCLLLPPLTGTITMGFQAHLDNLGRCHRELLD